MGSKSAQLQQWLDRNKPKADALEASGSIDWDAVIVPTDDASKQALQAQAEDLALEDSIVALDKAFHVGIQGLSLESYLKQVRTLCRRQFFARALGMKAAEMQQRQQPPLRPPPMPPVGVGLSSPLQGMDHFMPPPPIPVASRPPPPMQPMMIPTQALAAASASRPSSQPGPVPPPLPPYMQPITSNPMQPATSNPLQPVANPVIMRPMQARPIQPYPKVQR
ncbi:Vps23 core domain-containing protein [Dunaliella salina]|uniref:Vps23 core domain-containing protein n=1 Tax=Dunaliella salina TaxID=3046 RepID=A0ABQ7GUL9_DUNSA|nr:Vps23 core domain-containing protein [Dunaliella salina]|eukprot:KAF5838315.1 Vps23 core domain-containing protein [Dunaliella salina]